MKRRLKDVGDQKKYQGVALQNFDSTLEQCKKHVMDDICRLKQKINEHLEWSDIQLMRSILVLLETQSWQKSYSDDCNDDRDEILDLDDDFAEVRTTKEYIISIFRIPLEAKRMCVTSIQDEVEDVSYARKYLPIGSENYRKSGTNFTVVLTQADGLTFSSSVNFC